MALDEIGKLVDRWKLLLTNVGLLLAAAIGLWQQILKWHPSEWSWHEVFFASAATLLIIFVVINSHRARRSRLLDPEALKLDPQLPEHLIGRREELDKLLNVLGNPVVFLVGESGCGKSALIRSGIVKGPGFRSRFAPIYIDMSVLDWEDGPLRALREGFARSASDETLIQALLDGRSGPKAYSETFSNYQRHTHRRPLILLDQFDDYQARHRDRFLPPITRVWLNADAIAPTNAFWRVLRHCVQTDTVSIIVACREDAAAGLDSLRFYSEIPQFDLPRLEPDLVRLIIDRLTLRPPDQPPVIANPDRGWTALRDRLIDDQQKRGQLLPQQLRVILGGLRTLPRLTATAYARAGRAPGLEAAFVAGAITKAAVTSSIPEGNVLKLVSTLVDKKRQPPDKAPSRSTRELASTVGLSVSTATRLLRVLESQDILRPHLDFKNNTTAWQLDHAYLAQPILRIERERDHWRQLLIERAHTYAEVDWRGKWTALLPIRTQISLFVARLRGLFEYGQYRGFAIKSLSRALPVVAIIGFVGAVAWAFDEYEAAGRILERLAEHDRLSPGRWAGEASLTDDAAAALADLSARGMVTRWRVTHDIFNLAPVSPWFTVRSKPILRALVQLDSDRLDTLVRAYVTREALVQSDPRLRAGVVALIEATSLRALTPNTRLTFEKTLVDGIRSADSESSGFILANAVHTVAETLPQGGQEALQWLSFLRDAICHITDDEQVEPLARAYGAVAEHLIELDARVELGILTQLIPRVTDAKQREAVGHAYASVVLKADVTTPTDVLSVLHAFMKETKSTYSLNELAKAYASLMPKLSELDPRLPEVLQAVRDGIASTGGIYARDLAKLYASLAPHAHESAASREAVALRQAIASAGVGTNPYRIDAFAKAYTAVAAKLNQTETTRELALLHEEIGRTTTVDKLAALSRAYASVVPNHGDPHVAAVLAILRDAMKKPDRNFEFSRLAESYAAVVLKLKEPDLQAADVLKTLREATERISYPEDQADLARSYQAVAQRLSSDDPRVAEELAALRDTIGKSRELSSREALAQFYAEWKPDKKGADPDAERILTDLRNYTSDLPIRLTSPLFGQSYLAIAQLKHTDTAGELPILRDAITTATDSSQLYALARFYTAISSQLKDRSSDAANELVALRKAVVEIADSGAIGREADFTARFSNHVTVASRVAALAESYVAVARKVPASDRNLADLLVLLRTVFTRMKDPVDAVTVGEAYTTVAAELEGGDARAADELAALRDMMSKAGNENELRMLATNYATVAKVARISAVRRENFAVLLGSLPAMRTAEGCLAIAAAIKSVAQLGAKPMGWREAGLIYATALLQPVCAGKPTRQLVSDYEEILRGRSDAPRLSESWSGDVWAFTSWARVWLPEFDPHKPMFRF